jgi:similar to stage IV sporulation protein
MGFIEGSTRFAVSGFNLSKLINKLNKDGIRLFNVKTGNRTLVFSAKTANKHKIIAIFEELDYNYKIIEQTGARAFARALADYAGALVGAVVVIVYIAISASTLNSIEVTLPSRESEVLRLLSENGIKKGAVAAGIDVKGLERDLLSLDGVSFVSVRLKGNRLYVDLKSSLDEPRIEEFPVAGFVTAARKAVVSRVVVYDGTALVKIGEVVEVGDPLIAPYSTVNGARLDGYASGIVFGKTYYTAEMLYEGVRIVKTYGGARTYSATVLFGKKVKLPESPFKHSESVYTTSVTGFILPFTLYTVTYREIIYEHREQPFSVIEGELAAGLLAAARSKMPFGATFLSEWCNINETNGGVKMTAVVECEEIIGDMSSRK